MGPTHPSCRSAPVAIAASANRSPIFNSPRSELPSLETATSNWSLPNSPSPIIASVYFSLSSYLTCANKLKLITQLFSSPFSAVLIDHVGLSLETKRHQVYQEEPPLANKRPAFCYSIAVLLYLYHQKQHGPHPSFSTKKRLFSLNYLSLYIHSKKKWLLTRCIFSWVLLLQINILQTIKIKTLLDWMMFWRVFFWTPLLEAQSSRDKCMDEVVVLWGTFWTQHYSVCVFGGCQSSLETAFFAEEYCCSVIFEFIIRGLLGCVSTLWDCYMTVYGTKLPLL